MLCSHPLDSFIPPQILSAAQRFGFMYNLCWSDGRRVDPVLSDLRNTWCGPGGRGHAPYSKGRFARSARPGRSLPNGHGPRCIGYRLPGGFRGRSFVSNYETPPRSRSFRRYSGKLLRHERALSDNMERYSWERFAKIGFSASRRAVCPRFRRRCCTERSASRAA